MESFICNFVEVDLIGDYLGCKQIADMEINSLYASFVKNAGTNVCQKINLLCQDLGGCVLFDNQYKIPQHFHGKFMVGKLSQKCLWFKR